MCGIAGMVYLDGRPIDRGRDAPLLATMLNALRHRGPDEQSLLLWENLGIAFNRLSIVDPDAGQQPFHTRDGRISAVINGEIYNHRELRTGLRGQLFRSGSDCEVIPYLYQLHGREMFTDVNGMFAMALLDRERRCLLLARDRLGIKPLFYLRLESQGLLLFASELKALFAHPAVSCGFDWGEATRRVGNLNGSGGELASCFKGIHRVPAATLLEISLDLGKIKEYRYWQLDHQRSEHSQRSAGSYAEEYRELLRDSVHKRLMADVGYGLFLSGGIDSAMVAALAAERGPLPTFSVLTRSTIGNGESRTSRDVANALGLENHQVFFDWESPGLEPDHWRRILWHCELFDITAEQLFKFHLHGFARERYPGLKMILLGQGSDEFTGGYLEWMIGGSSPWGNDSWQQIDHYLRRQQGIRQGNRIGCGPYFQEMIDQELIDPEALAYAPAEPDGPVDTWARYTHYWRQNLDLHLWHEDRTASAFSIESRVPFLDHRLIEFLSRIPRSLHPELFTDKRILRSAAQGIVPESVRMREKGYFFYGRDQHYTFRMMLNLLQSHQGELIDQAIAGSERSGGPLVADRLRLRFNQIGSERRLHEITPLLFLVNMGLLADMALDGMQQPRAERPLSIRELRGESLASLLNDRQAQPSSEELAAVVPALAQGCRLVEVRASGGAAAKGEYLMLMDGAPAQPQGSPAWIKFLLALDGVQTADRIITRLQINRSRTLRQLASALERGELVSL